MARPGPWDEDPFSAPAAVGRLLRVVAVEPATASLAREVAALATIDVVSRDRRGELGTVVSAVFNRGASSVAPSAVDRLRGLSSGPEKPDALVVGHPDLASLLERYLKGGPQLLVAPTAAERLWRSVPATVMRQCWRQGAGDAVGVRARVEAQATFVAGWLDDMLDFASADEVLWLGSVRGA